MISHKYKCIFIHIPRTAGSSVEHWINGENQWKSHPREKHLLASQAKKMYQEYWDDYFKFSIVRNPWDRKVSMLKHPFYRVRLDARKTIDVSRYKRKYGYPIILELDSRSGGKRRGLLSDKHKANSVYLNMLDEEIDFVAKFENLGEDLCYVKSQLGLAIDFNIHKERSIRDSTYQKYYDDSACADVADLYGNDITHFGYEFDSM